MAFQSEQYKILWSKTNTKISKLNALRKCFLKMQCVEPSFVSSVILGNSIIRQFFIDGNPYLHLLQNNIVPVVHGEHINFNKIWIRHDGCPSLDGREKKHHFWKIPCKIAVQAVKQTVVGLINVWIQHPWVSSFENIKNVHG